MIKLSHVSVYVLNQDSALRFYTEKLGFETYEDVLVEEGGLRWLTVGPRDQPDLRFVLAEVGPAMFDEESAEYLRAVVAKGAMGVGAFRTDDCRAAYAELSARGVEFVQEPAERPYGIEALFRDDSGNWFSLTQRPGP
jgi:catechol 2,3-dioxygenase-like lactoylglutathione lyase family enzyme